MDDLRLDWLRNQINLALGIKNNIVFEEFILRESENNEDDLVRFLSTPTDGKSAVPKTAVFYTQETKVAAEEEVDVFIGKEDDTKLWVSQGAKEFGLR